MSREHRADNYQGLIQRLMTVGEPGSLRDMCREAAVALDALVQEQARYKALNGELCHAHNVLLTDGADWQERARKAEKQTRIYLGIAGACLGGTDHVHPVAAKCENEYDAFNKAYAVWRERIDETVQAAVKPLREHIEKLESK